jgi:cytochrome c553
MEDDLMQKHNRFARGSGKYTCVECGKSTRETGNGESSANLCAECYEEAELLNAVSDGDMPELAALAEANPNARLIDLKKQLEAGHADVESK